jgi:hypothetical protein
MKKKIIGRCVILFGLSLLLSFGCMTDGKEARANVEIEITPYEAIILPKSGDQMAYKSLDTAVSEAGKYPGCTIKLLKDITTRNTSLKLAGKNYTLDLSGRVIARSRINYADRGEVITIKEGADVKIKDSDPNASHFYYKDKGGLITGGSSKNSAGGIHIEKNASLTMTGGTITDCYSKYEGAGLRNENGNVRLNGVTIKSNVCDDNGGGIIHMNGSMVLTDCVIKNNLSKKSGGGIMIKGENVEFHGCSIENNQANDKGGGIVVRQDKVFIDGGYIMGNVAKNGGGVYVDSYRDINIQGRLIIDGNKGGGNVKENLYLQDGTATSARIYDGGLLPGSRVNIAKSGSSDASYKAVIGATEYEWENGLIAVDEGRGWFSETSNKKEVFMATAFDWYGWGILLFIVLELIGVYFMFRQTLNRKRIKKEDKNSENIK